MTQNYKLSFKLFIGFIFLIPLFFIPGTILSLGIAKLALFVAGLAIACLFFAYESFRAREIVIPKHSIVIVIALLPVVYLLSALLATPSSLSLFGYGFEAGTFGFMLLGSAALILSSAVFNSTSRILQAISVFLVSLTILVFFVAAKVLMGGDALSFGNFAGNMGNPLGSWTDLGMVFGMLALLSALTAGMIPMKSSMKTLVYVMFFLSTALMVVINFQTAFIFTLVASVLVMLYFFRVEKHFYHQLSESSERRKGFFSGPMLLPLFLGIVSLVFLVNPNVTADQKLGQVVSQTLGVNNSEYRPTLATTLSISKAVLSQAGLLGSGPNTFGHDWLIFKPANVNATPFWAATFPFGVGFLPTQIATTGILGSVLWVIFFGLLISLAIRAFARIPESRGERFTLIFTMFGSIFLWVGSFVYVPSSSVLMLTFLFTGFFIATLSHAGFLENYKVNLGHNSHVRAVAMIALALVVIGAVSVGWVGGKKAIGAYHYNKAIAISNIPSTPLAGIESLLVKAINTDPEDVYFVSLSKLNMVRAQAAANSATGTPEEKKSVFEDSIRRSIEAARLAVSANPAGFENWVALGGVYSSLVPEPLAVEGSYENAVFAYDEAAKRNPSNPEIPLARAQLEINKKNIDAARSYIRNAISLKEDYADAYLMLAQLEVGAGNTAAAIASAENLAILVPENSGIQFELGLLKFSSKNYEGAVKSFEKAVKITPEYANAKYYLGLALANIGKFEEAQIQLESISAANPDNAELQAALDSVKAKKVPLPPGSNPQPTKR